MTDPQLGMLMLGLFIFIIMLGFPIAFTLMAMGVSFGYYAYYTPGQDFFQNRIFTLLVQKTFEVTSSDVLVAVPLFLFMGYLIERANILDRLFYSLQLSMKNVPGALSKLVSRLGKRGININYVYSTACTCKTSGCDCLAIISAPDLKAVEEAWQA